MPKRSWVVQRLANRLPDWSEARQLPHSVTQQLLNPIGAAIEAFFKATGDEIGDRFLSGCNMSQMSTLHHVTLPNTYTFGVDSQNTYGSSMLAPEVTATAPDTSVVTVEMPAQNTIAAFWYDAIPTRCEDLEESLGVTAVLEETALADLASATPNTIVLPGRLYLTITDGTSFRDDSRIAPLSAIVITGTFRGGLEGSETIYIPCNGTFITKKHWQEVEKIEYYGIEPDTATISAQCFAFNQDRAIDRYNLLVTQDTEKFIFKRLGSNVFLNGTYSIEEGASFVGNDISTLSAGSDDLEVIASAELLYDNSGTLTNVDLNDLTIQPFFNRVIGIDNTHLYIWDAMADALDCQGLKDRSINPMMVIEVEDGPCFLRGDTIAFHPRWREPLQRVLRNRWSIIKPDGTLVYLDINGSEVTSTNAWIPNLMYTELMFGPFTQDEQEVDSQELEYTLSDRGTYKIILEVQYADGTTETDIVPVMTVYKTAIARLALPTALQGATGIFFDSDHQLWLLKTDSADMAHKMKLATDVMLIDFTNKIIYFHEPYTTVTVEDGEDLGY